jgi:DNA repair exonuclease SbcCD ATPase subunit
MANENLGASFSIDITELKAGLAQANRLIRESESEFREAAAGMDDWTKSQEGLEKRQKSLNTQIDLQKGKIENLVEQRDLTIKKMEEEGKTAEQISLATDKYNKSITNESKLLDKLKGELKKTEKALDELGEETEDAGKGFEDLGDSAKDAGDGFTVAKGAAADLIANGISALISSCKDAVSNLMNLSAETEEYRSSMAKLKTTFEQNGKSVEDATKTYKELYSVLGDEGQASEAAMHLAALTETEEEMAKWQEILIGANARWGASLPVEGLAEAANEVSRTGILTGGLTDAINWASDANETFGVTLKANTEANEEYNKKVEEATNAEEYFQIALDECNTEQERQKLLMDTLTKLYGESATEHKENNAKIIEARKATADYTEVMAELGEEMQPVTTKITNLQTTFAKKLTPVVKKDVIPVFEDFIDTISDGDTLEEFADNVSDIAKTALPPLSKAVKFCAENLDTLVSVGGTAVTVFAAFNAVMKVSATVNAVKTAVAGLSAGVGVATKMQVGWNAAMSANPIGAVLTAVGLLTAGIVVLSSKQAEATKSADLLNESQRATVTAAEEAAKAYRDEKKAADELAGSQMANVDYVKNNLLPQLSNLVDANGKVKQGEEERANFILNELNNALGTEYQQLSDIVGANGQIKDSIYAVIEAKKAQILLEAYEESYRLAVEKVAEAEKARAIQAQEIAAQEAVYSEAERLATEARMALNEKAATVKTEAEGRMLAAEADRVVRLESNAEAEKQKLAEKTAAYDESEAALFQYYKDISDYQTASTLLAEGETAKAVSYLNNLSSGFQTVASTAKLSADEQKKILGQQVVDTEVNAILMKEAYEKGVEGVSEEMVKTAEEQAENAKKEFHKVGGDITKGISEGAEKEEWSLTKAMRGLIDRAVSAARTRMDAHSPSRLFEKEVGKDMGLGVAVGVRKSTSAVVSAMQDQIEAARGAYSVGSLNFGNISASGNGKNGAHGLASGSAGGVVVHQVNHYSQAHSRFEIWQSEKNTAAAVKLALMGG